MTAFLKRISLLLLLSLLAACSKPISNQSRERVSANGDEPAIVSGTPGDCDQFIASLPSDYFHDWITVPEDPHDIDGTKIKVFYYGPKKLNENVVIFYNGGPGSDSHGTRKMFDEDIAKYSLQEKISFIYMDQRGTGCSSGYPIEHTANDVLRSRWYGSTGIVYDSEAIRKVLLGDKKWKVFGQSYGAFVVHRYVAIFPESIDAAYAHANVINSDPLQRLYQRIYSQYRVLEMYLTENPEDREKLQYLKNYLTVDKCFDTVHNGKMCGHEFLTNLTSLLGFSQHWPRIHGILNSVVIKESGINRVDEAALQKAIKDYFDQDSPPAGLAIGTIGMFDRNTVNSDTKNCKWIYRQLAKNGITEEKLLMNECSLTIQVNISLKSTAYIKNVIGTWLDTLKIYQFKYGLSKLAPMRFFLYSGEKDSFVPKENFSEELREVQDKINYTHFMNSGHEGFHTEKQVWDDLIK